MVVGIFSVVIGVAMTLIHPIPKAQRGAGGYMCKCLVLSSYRLADLFSQQRDFMRKQSDIDCAIGR